MDKSHNKSVVMITYLKDVLHRHQVPTGTQAAIIRQLNTYSEAKLSQLNRMTQQGFIKYVTNEVQDQLSPS